MKRISFPLSLSLFPPGQIRNQGTKQECVQLEEEGFGQFPLSRVWENWRGRRDKKEKEEGVGVRMRM